MNEHLMAAIPFTLEDLAANRQGQLTPDQNLRLQREFSESESFVKKIAFCLWAAAVLLVVVMLVIGLPGALTASLAKTGFSREPDTLRGVVFGLSCAAVVLAGFCSLFALIAKKGRQNLSDDLPVFAVIGTVEKSEFENWYTLKVNDREFVFADANDPVYKTFEEGRSYSIYYIFNTANIIVSAERVS